MYVCVCMYTLLYANNNNAKIKLITRFSVYECVCVCLYGVRWYGQEKGDL